MSKQQPKERAKNPAVHISAAGVAALISFPLWKMATIGQSGWKTDGQMFYDKMISACKPPYKGVVATLFGMTWARAAIFHGSEYFKPIMLEQDYGMAAATSIPPLIIGTFAQVVNMPLVRATITVQNPTSIHSNIIGASKEIIATQGIKGLWHGTVPAVGKTVPKYIVAVAIKDWCQKNLARADSDSDHKHFWSLWRSAKKSVAAGVCGAALTNPFDVIRNEMFKTNLGIVASTRKLYGEMGYKFMVRGVARNMISVALPVALTIFLADIFNDLEVFHPSENKANIPTAH